MEHYLQYGRPVVNSNSSSVAARVVTLNIEPWTEPAGSVCVVVVSALRGPNIMRPFYIVYASKKILRIKKGT